VKQGAGGELKPGNRRLMATYGTVLGNTKKKVCGKKKHNYKLYIVLIYSNSTWKNAMSLPCLNIRGWILHSGAGA